MDELPEFDGRVLEALREPLESGAIHLARAAGRLDLPAEFQLVAAMNPCPCGYLGDESRLCRCGPRRVQRYRDRLSGPLLDRLDLQIEVPRVELPALQAGTAAGGPSLDCEGSGAALAPAVPAARARPLAPAKRCNAPLDHAGHQAPLPAPPPALSPLRALCT